MAYKSETKEVKLCILVFLHKMKHGAVTHSNSYTQFRQSSLGMPGHKKIQKLVL